METQTKKLYRSRKNRIIGGVSAGLGEYFSIDPVLVRVIFILLTFKYFKMGFAVANNYYFDWSFAD